MGSDQPLLQVSNGTVRQRHHGFSSFAQLYRSWLLASEEACQQYLAERLRESTRDRRAWGKQKWGAQSTVCGRRA
jgi:hypothetical protein